MRGTVKKASRWYFEVSTSRKFRENKAMKRRAWKRGQKWERGKQIQCCRVCSPSAAELTGRGGEGVAHGGGDGHIQVQGHPRNLGQHPLACPSSRACCPGSWLSASLDARVHSASVLYSHWRCDWHGRRGPQLGSMSCPLEPGP